MQRRSSQLNTQRMSVQRSGNCASKPTGNWSLSWFVIDPEMMIEDEIMNSIPMPLPSIPARLKVSGLLSLRHKLRV